MFVSKEQNILFYFLISVSGFLCFQINPNVVEAFTVKNVRGRDFSGKNHIKIIYLPRVSK